MVKKITQQKKRNFGEELTQKLRAKTEEIFS